jgi:hypothetical protein
MKADEERARKAAWRLKEAGQEALRKDYVKTPAARVNLPAPIVKAAVELLEKNRRFLFGKTRGFGPRRRCGWRRLRCWVFL